MRCKCCCSCERAGRKTNNPEAKRVIKQNYPLIYSKYFADKKTYDTVVAQYTMSSEMARQAIDRRIEINKFYVTAIGAGAAGGLASIKLFENQPTLIAVTWITLSLLGMFMCRTWRAWIVFLIEQSSFRQEVLQEFEEALPASHWRALNARLDVQGIDSKKLERVTPRYFSWACFFVGLAAAVYLLCGPKSFGAIEASPVKPHLVPMLTQL